MRDSLISLLQTVRLIYSVSRYYNTSERTSSLMVKITNQMIVACKDYITKRGRETVWSQDRTTARTKLKHSLRLNKLMNKHLSYFFNSIFYCHFLFCIFLIFILEPTVKPIDLCDVRQQEQRKNFVSLKHTFLASSIRFV